MKFYIPAPDEWDPRTRVELTFGLGDAIRYHREMTVPGIGGLRFVRQASWAVAGIDIAIKDIGEQHYKARDLANAIEALGCKIEYCHVGKDHYKYIGSRAFGRNPNAYLFKDLRKESFYVRNTYRQTIVTALTSLGLCDSSTRFNQMHLTDVGNDLKDAFYQSRVEFRKSGKERCSKGSCGDFLFEWINGNDFNVLGKDDFFKALSITTPTDGEKIILRNRLYSRTPKIEYDCDRRIRLINVMSNIDLTQPSENLLCEKIEELGGIHHSRQIRDAINFNKIRQDSIALLSACALLVNDLGNSEVKLSECIKKESIKAAYESLQYSCRFYLDNLYKREDVPASAIDFANTIVGKSKVDGIEYLVSKEYGVLDVVDHRLRPLNLFKKFVDRFSKSPETDTEEADDEDCADLVDSSQEGFILPRLNQWLQLWKDTYAK